MSNVDSQRAIAGRPRRIYDLLVGAPQYATTAADHRQIYDLHSGTIHVKVAWDGRANSMGQMQVEAARHEWQDLQFLQPGVHDTLTLKRPKSFKVIFERGDEHGRWKFQVKAVPIQWLIAPSALEGDERNTFTAERGIHYEYAGGAHPTTTPFQTSVASGSVHRAEIELRAGQDYELWFRLRNPHVPNDWLEQDPIIRTGTSADAFAYMPQARDPNDEEELDPLDSEARNELRQAVADSVHEGLEPLRSLASHIKGTADLPSAVVEAIDGDPE